MKKRAVMVWVGVIILAIFILGCKNKEINDSVVGANEYKFYSQYPSEQRVLDGNIYVNSEEATIVIYGVKTATVRDELVRKVYLKGTNSINEIVKGYEMYIINVSGDATISVRLGY